MVVGYESRQPVIGDLFNFVATADEGIDMRQVEAVSFLVFKADGDQVVEVNESVDGDADSVQALAVIDTVWKAPGVGGTWSKVTQAAAGSFTHADAANDLLVFTVRADQLSATYTTLEWASTGTVNLAVAHGLRRKETPASLESLVVDITRDPEGLVFIQDNATAYYTTTGLAVDDQEIEDQLGNHANAVLGSSSSPDASDPTIVIDGDETYTSSDGVDDYIQLPATLAPTFTATTGGHSVVMLGRDLTAIKTHHWWSSQSAGADGAHFGTVAATSARVLVGGSGGNGNATTAIPNPDELIVIGFVQDAGAVASYQYGVGLGSTVDTTSFGTITHATPKLFRRSYTSANVAALDWFAIVVFESAIAETDLDTVSAYLITQAGG